MLLVLLLSVVINRTIWEYIQNACVRYNLYRIIRGRPFFRHPPTLHRGVGYPLPAQHPGTHAGRTPDRITPPHARSLIALRNPAVTALRKLSYAAVRPARSALPLSTEYSAPRPSLPVIVRHSAESIRINPNSPHESLQKLKVFLHFQHLNSVKWELYRVHRAINGCLAKYPSFERLPGSHAVNRDVNLFRPVIIVFRSIPQAAVGSLFE